MGGVGFTSTGNLLVTPCGFSGGNLRVFDQVTTVSQRGSLIHPLLQTLTSGAGCGIANHPDGTLYSNTSLGIVNLSESDGHILRTIGAPGNALGITVDPSCSNGQVVCPPTDHRLVYVAENSSDIRTVDPNNPSDDQLFISLPASFAAFIDGIVFNFQGSQLLMSVRSPTFGVGQVQVLATSAGARGASNPPPVLIPIVHEPDGISFSGHTNSSSVSPAGFAITNNTDATMTLLNLASSQPYTLAGGGFRGDLTQVGSDGFLYITQDGTRYDDGTTLSNDSVVRIGPAGYFSVPFGTAQVTLTPLLGANVVGSAHTVTASIGTSSSGSAIHLQSAGTTIRFTVISGPNAGLTGTAVTDASGTATFTYTGSTGGTDFIQASFIDTGGTTRFSNQVQQPWSTAICDVNADGAINSDDIALILLARGQSAQPGDARDVDRDGIITVTDARLCALKCTKMNCAK
jgi:hypothetical protein